jgi:hypothetical protein
MWRPTTTESETHVVLFTAGFLGRGFDSRRLHHLIFSKLGLISIFRVHLRSMESCLSPSRGFCVTDASARTKCPTTGRIRRPIRKNKSQRSFRGNVSIPFGQLRLKTIVRFGHLVRSLPNVVRHRVELFADLFSGRALGLFDRRRLRLNLGTLGSSFFLQELPARESPRLSGHEIFTARPRGENHFSIVKKNACGIALVGEILRAATLHDDLVADL